MQNYNPLGLASSDVEGFPDSTEGHAGAPCSLRRLLHTNKHRVYLLLQLQKKQVYFPTNIFLLLNFLNAMAYIVQAVLFGAGWGGKQAYSRILGVSRVDVHPM